MRGCRGLEITRVHDAQSAQVQIPLIISFFYCEKNFFKSLKPYSMQEVSRRKLVGRVAKKKDHGSLKKRDEDGSARTKTEAETGGIRKS